MRRRSSVFVNGYGSGSGEHPPWGNRTVHQWHSIGL